MILISWMTLPVESFHSTAEWNPFHSKPPSRTHRSTLRTLTLTSSPLLRTSLTSWTRSHETSEICTSPVRGYDPVSEHRKWETSSDNKKEKQYIALMEKSYHREILNEWMHRNLQQIQPRLETHHQYWPWLSISPKQLPSPKISAACFPHSLELSETGTHERFK